MNIKETIKEHPYATGLIVFAALLAFVLLRSRSSGSTAYTVGPSSSDVQAGNDLAIAQLQAQQASNQTTAQAGVAGQQIAGQVSVANLAATTQQNADSLNAQTTQVVANLQAQTQQLVSTLSAQVANIQTGASVSENANNNATALGIASLPYQLQEFAISHQPTSSVSQAQIDALTSSVNNLTTNTVNIADHLDFNLDSNTYAGNYGGHYTGNTISTANGVSKIN